MNDWPTTLVIPPRPLARRPSKPEIGAMVQVLYYNVESRMVGGRETFYVWNTAQPPAVLSMGHSWERMCHQLGWFPLDGLEHRAPLPSEQAPAPSKHERPAAAASSTKRTISSTSASPASNDPAIGVAEGPPVDPRQTSLF